MRTVRTRIEFMAAMKSELERFGVADRNEILADFTQHFNDSAKQGLSEAEVCEKLGDITEIAKQYADEYTVPVSGGSEGVSGGAEGISGYTPELIFPDPTAVYSSENTSSKTNPLVLDDFGDAKEIEELIKAAPVHPDAEDKTWQSETAVPTGNVSQEETGEQGGQSDGQSDGQNTQNNQNSQSNQNTQNSNNSSNGNWSGGIYINTEEIKQNINHIGRDIKDGWNNFTANNTSISIKGLIAVLCVDVFVFSWALPALFATVAGLLSIPVALIASGFGTVIEGVLGAANISTSLDFLGIGTSAFGTVSTILLGAVLLCLGGLSALVGIKLVKLCITAVKGVINWHGRMIVGKPVFKSKNQYVKS